MLKKAYMPLIQQYILGGKKKMDKKEEKNIK